VSAIFITAEASILSFGLILFGAENRTFPDKN